MTLVKRNGSLSQDLVKNDRLKVKISALFWVVVSVCYEF